MDTQKKSRFILMIIASLFVISSLAMVNCGGGGGDGGGGGGTTYNVGGIVSGLTGTLVLQNNAPML